MKERRNEPFLKNQSRKDSMMTTTKLIKLNIPQKNFCSKGVSKYNSDICLTSDSSIHPIFNQILSGFKLCGGF